MQFSTLVNLSQFKIFNEYSQVQNLTVFKKIVIVLYLYKATFLKNTFKFNTQKTHFE